VTNARLGGLGRKGLILLAWMLIRAALQAAVILLLANCLGTSTYGKFVSAIAVYSFFVPFVGLGLSHVVMRNGARDPTHSAYYLSYALKWWRYSLLPCSIAALGTALWTVPHAGSAMTLGLLAAAELSAGSLAELATRHYQSQQRVHVYGTIGVALPAARLLALGATTHLAGRTDLVLVAWSYSGASIIFACAVLPLLTRRQAFAFESGSEKMSSKSGLPFSFAVLSTKLQNEFNKPVLAQSSFVSVGAFNIAQRLVELASLPLTALQEALWPRLHSIENASAQLIRSGAALLICALLLGICTWTIAPSLPNILGSQFDEAVPILQMLAWLPVFQTVRALFNFRAIHAGLTGQFAWIYGTGSACGVASVAILVPPYGTTGAVISSYIGEAAVIFFFYAGSKLRKIARPQR
tara:strand:- start:1757 stop:2986 length:1230 start_codon:yes stop_codon:yes gene_type:complete